MATYAIGDVQGCAATLDRLLAKLPLAKSDRLWFAGDLVNRGPSSAAVVRTVRAFGARATTVLGNHDLQLLARSEDLVKAKKGDTLEDVLGAKDAPELCGWVRERPLLHRDGDRVLVHAGIPPRWSVDDAESFARAAENALRGTKWRDVLVAYAKKSTRSPEKLDGAERHAATCVALTTLRTVGPDGKPDAGFKGPPEDAPRGHFPWFRAPGRKSAAATIVFGHWAALGLHIEPRVIATDSGCVWGNELTAVRLDDVRVFQEACADLLPGS